jgi:hypothetical protein
MVLLASFKMLHPFLQFRRLCPNCSDSGFGKVASWPEQFVMKKGFWFPTTKDIQEQAAVPSLP